MSIITYERGVYFIQWIAIITISFLFLKYITSLSLIFHLAWPIIYALFKFVGPANKMYKKVLFDAYCYMIYENDTFWGLFYDTICYFAPKKALTQINYGYAPLTNDGKLVALPKEFEDERMSVQLYHRTVTGMGIIKDLKGLIVLEVSSGRAGGINYISKCLGVKKCIGLDLSANNINYSKETHSGDDKLEFIVGNAETFVDEGLIRENSIDVVISVDSAHLYPNFDRFIEQCRLALKPNGYFCMSDFMEKGKYVVNEELLKLNELEFVKKEVTSQNVLKAMDIDGERRNKEVAESCPSIFKPLFYWNSGAKGSRIYKLLESGQFKASTWVFQKKKTRPNSN